jgi:NAD(P)-dependent dehydrogenase (short-subunit alcohol dehydrogenase family)
VDDFVQSLRRNIVHVYALTHYALDALIEAKGFVVNVTSKVPETGQGETSGYAASKGAMNALTREWALDLAKFGIRVNAVAPAEVLTPMYESWAQGKEDPVGYLAEVCERIPLGQRMTSAEEIANAVVFLASEKSSHTTGQIVYPDGGYVHLDRSYLNDRKS